MYPLDLSVAAGARRAQFLSWAFPTDTKIPKPPGYDGLYHHVSYIVQLPLRLQLQLRLQLRLRLQLQLQLRLQLPLPLQLPLQYHYNYLPIM